MKKSITTIYCRKLRLFADFPLQYVHKINQYWGCFYDSWRIFYDRKIRFSPNFLRFSLNFLRFSLNFLDQYYLLLHPPHHCNQAWEWCVRDRIVSGVTNVSRFARCRFAIIWRLSGEKNVDCTHSWNPATATRFWYKFYAIRGLRTRCALHPRLNSIRRYAAVVAPWRAPW